MEGYYFIELQSSSSNIASWKQKKGVMRKIYLWYMSKKAPILVEPIGYLGEKGEKMILPFTEEEKMSLSHDYFQEFIRKIIEKNQIKKCYVTGKLRKEEKETFKNYLFADESILLYMMFPDIILRMSKDMNIEYKNLRITMIDGQDGRIEYLLETMVNEINYLTIITRRSEYFQGYIDMIYDTKGLVIQLEENITEEGLEDNIVVDLSRDSYQSLRGALAIIDMNSSEKKLNYYYARRKKMTVIYNILLEAEGKAVDNSMLEYLFLRNYQFIRDFICDRNRECYIREFYNLKERLGLSINRLMKL